MTLWPLPTIMGVPPSILTVSRQQKTTKCFRKPFLKSLWRGWGVQPHNNRRLIPLAPWIFSSPVLLPKGDIITNICPGKPHKTPETLLACGMVWRWGLG